MAAVATTERPERAARPLAAAPASRLFAPGEGRRSLEDVILRIGDELEREGHAGCPVCGDRLERGSPCRGCGSELY